jgi:uncharacterized membrane protein
MWATRCSPRISGATTLRSIAFSKPPEHHEGLLRQYGVDYLFWGPEEQAMATLDPDASPWFTEVFRAGDVAVYRVMVPER